MIMKLKTFLILTITFSLIAGCQDDDQQFGELVTPSNLNVDLEVIGSNAESPGGDGSGDVSFKASADNAITFKFFYGDNTEEIVPSGEVLKTYNSTGVFTATVVASGRGGLSTSTTVEVNVRSDFSDPETQLKLTGGEGNSKTWFVAKAESGHLGVGPVDTFTPDFFSATPNLLAECFYNDQITIGQTNGSITFNHDNAGETFFNAEFVNVGGGTANGSDQCLPFDTSGDKFIELSGANSNVPEELSVGTNINISDQGFMSYFINTSSYEVLEITDDFLSVRALSGSPNPLAWYFKFTTNPDGTVSGG